MYHPTSMTYITKLIPVEQRKRFNSLRSLLDSGAFVTGPAIAGLLFTIGSPNMAIYLNAIALFLSACITFRMPNIEANQQLASKADAKFSYKVLFSDWKLVIRFSLKNPYIMMVYLLFSAMIVMMTATDSLEAAFATQILSLSEGEYGILVGIAGAGVLVGSLMNTAIVEKIPTAWLIGLGSLITALGYLIFTSSYTFLIASLGCFTLSFAMAFANTGFHTFYQNNIPVDSMGRIGSIYGFVEALFIIIITAVFGVAAEITSIRYVVVCAAIIMFVVAFVLLLFNVTDDVSIALFVALALLSVALALPSVALISFSRPDSAFHRFDSSFQFKAGMSGIHFTLNSMFTLLKQKGHEFNITIDSCP